MKPAPDTILLNAAIHTMDASLHRARALAVTGGRIAALGSDDEMRALKGPKTRIIDAGGRMVLPGFQDAHIHLLDGGHDMATSASLYEVTNLEALITAMSAHAARVKTPLVMGTGWQSGTFGDHNLTRAALDAAVSDWPAIAYDSSFHNACLNSAACKLIGLDTRAEDPPNGHIVRDAKGVPTGMLHEDAILWARTLLPGTDEAELAEGLRTGMAHAARHGITGIIDPKIEPYHARTYSAFDREGSLTLRVSGAALVAPGERAEDVSARLTRLRAEFGGRHFQINAAKFFFDGVLENRTAAMLTDYADPMGGNAPVMFGTEETARLFTVLDAARFQIHVHAIGDAAVRAALDGIEAAQKANGAWPALHQIAHVQVVDPADLGRFASLGVMANTQPLWARWDPVVPDEWLEMVGPARGPSVYPFRSLIARGAPYCLSSDFSVTTLNPFHIMETAVTRQPRAADGPSQPFYPEERLTISEAIAGYTVHAAAACWRGHETGRLIPGFSADLVILSQNLHDCPADAISDTEVLLTLFAGEIVHQAAAFSA